MAYSNPYFRFSKLSEGTFGAILACFAKDLTATSTAEITGVSVRSVNAIFLRIRQRLVEYRDAGNTWPPEPPASGLIHDSAEGRVSVECGECGKYIVLGLLGHRGRIHAEIVPPSLKTMLQALIRGQLTLQAVIGSGHWRGYDGLVDLEFDRLFRVNQEGHGVTPDCWDGIEAFWHFTESRLRKFHGLHGRTFWLHLKECEFRFNQREQDLLTVLKHLLRTYPL
jgi:transposase